MYLVSVSSKHICLIPKSFKAHTYLKPSLPQQSLPSDSGFDNAKVSTLIAWSFEHLSLHITPDQKLLFSAIPVTAPNIPDSVVWLYSKNGAFTVKSGYHFQDYEDVQYATSS